MNTTTGGMGRTSELPAGVSRQLAWFSVPFLFLILSQLPLAIVYVRNLWLRQPHYRFLPFLLALMIWLVWSRWPKGSSQPVLPSLVSWLFLVVGLLFGIASTLFLNPWMSACAFCCFVSAWLGRIQDAERTGRSLLKVGMLSFLGLQLPLGQDRELIQLLQQVSAQTASKLLELFGQLHDMPGTQLSFPGEQPYFVEEACSGVQSLFTLLFCAGALGVACRYSFLRIGALLVLASLWAVVMNTARIMAIPMAEIHWGVDLVHGWQHEVLGYAALLSAMGLLLCSDSFISVFFLPVGEQETFDPRDEDESIWMVWRQRLAWYAGWFQAKDVWRDDGIPTAGQLRGQFALWLLVPMFLLAGVWQAIDVQSLLFGGNQTVKFFSDTELIAFGKDDLPVRMGRWECRDFESVDRERSSELGQHSDTWYYRSPRFLSLMSVDQPFPGWHELSKCYTNAGYRRLKRKLITPEPEGEEEPWSYVQVEFENQLGERGYLLFSFVAADGSPFNTPDDWDLVTSLYNRIRNRLNDRLRRQLFQSETFQIQIWVPTTHDLPEQLEEEIHEQYLALREEVRQLVAERGGEVPGVDGAGD